MHKCIWFIWCWLVMRVTYWCHCESCLSTCFTLSKQREQVLYRLGQSCRERTGGKKQSLKKMLGACYTTLAYIKWPKIYMTVLFCEAAVFYGWETEACCLQLSEYILHWVGGNSGEGNQNNHSVLFSFSTSFSCYVPGWKENLYTTCLEPQSQSHEWSVEQ